MANTRKSQSTDLDRLFSRFCELARPLVERRPRVVVAFSGGLDSTVLLHLFVRLRAQHRFSLSALHVHHGISAHADDWATHCAHVCEGVDVALRCERVDLTDWFGDSLEARARTARYAAYASAGADIVALAHHRDDQAETVLYRLMRGAGVHGASGMPVMRPLGEEGVVWRPLLGHARHELLAYAIAHDLNWIEDESNASSCFDRNFLRHAVVPVLAGRFPSAQDALVRAGGLFGEAAILLDALAEQDAGGCTHRLDLSRLLALDDVRQRNVLRWFLAAHGLRLERVHIEQIQWQFLTAAHDANPLFRIGDREIRRYDGTVWLTRSIAAPDACRIRYGAPSRLGDWAGALDWLGGKNGMRRSFSGGMFDVRRRQGGERIRPRLGGPTRPVKHLMQEAGIPPWLRVRWPLLWHDDRLAAVPGVAVDAAFQSGDDDGLRPCWRPDDWRDAPDWLIAGQGAGESA